MVVVEAVEEGGAEEAEEEVGATAEIFQKSTFQGRKGSVFSFYSRVVARVCLSGLAFLYQQGA